MITKETAAKIYFCHEEIEKSEALISEMTEILQNEENELTPKFYNAFGEKRGLELGVPSGKNSHRLFNVPPELSMKIIQQHINDRKKRLDVLMDLAKQELA